MSVQNRACNVRTDRCDLTLRPSTSRQVSVYHFEAPHHNYSRHSHASRFTVTDGLNTLALVSRQLNVIAVAFRALDSICSVNINHCNSGLLKALAVKLARNGSQYTGNATNMLDNACIRNEHKHSLFVILIGSETEVCQYYCVRPYVHACVRACICVCVCRHAYKRVTSCVRFSCLSVSVIFNRNLYL